MLPINQNLDYDFHLSTSIFEPMTILCLCFILALLSLAIYLFNRNRIISFSIFWFFLTLGVESSIIPISDLIYEHRTYLPSFGFFTILSMVIFTLFWDKNKNIALIIITLIIGLYSLMTYKRNKVWKDNLSLWNDAVSKSTNKAKTYFSRGLIYDKQKNYDMALLDYSRAIKLKSCYYDALNNRGIIYGNENKNDLAYQDFTTAITLKPDFINAYNNRGSVLMHMNKLDEALNDYNKSIALDSNYAEPYNYRGNIYARQSNYIEALKNLKIAIRLKPNYAEAFSNLGNLQGMQKKYDEALAFFDKAIELKSDYSEAYFNRGLTYFNLGKNENACKDMLMAAKFGHPVAADFHKKNCK